MLLLMFQAIGNIHKQKWRAAWLTTGNRAEGLKIKGIYQYRLRFVLYYSTMFHSAWYWTFWSLLSPHSIFLKICFRSQRQLLLLYLLFFFFLSLISCSLLFPVFICFCFMFVFNGVGGWGIYFCFTLSLLIP